MMGRWVRSWNADEDGLSPDEWRSIWWEEDCLRRLMRWRALKALWLPPVRSEARDSRKGWTVDDGHERGRDEESTFWRAVRATIGVIFDISPRLDPMTGNYVDWHHAVTLAYWDSRQIYGGYTVEVLDLHAGFGISLFNDGETSM
jgi:hypothetical protein